jgi:hypothetical protein
MVTATAGSAPMAEHREEARRLRTLAETVTTQAMRQILLDVAATYDKLARSAASGNVGREDHAGEMSQMREHRISDASRVRERDRG